MKQLNPFTAHQTKIKAGLAGLGIVILLIMILVLADKTIIFFKDNTILKHNPIEVKLHRPLEVVALAELARREENDKMVNDLTDKILAEYLNPKPKETCSQTTQIDLNKFFHTLRIKESSKGQNLNPSALHNYCKDKGMWNEIGYSPKTKFCFKDEEEAKLYVAYYAKKNCDNKTQAQCECYWNTGNMTDSCYYSEGKLGLAN